MGFFNFFSKPKPLEPYDLGSIGLDLHSHLIPGIDDGAKNLEDSIALIRGMYELGYRKFITTPHIMSDYYRNTPEIINAGLNDLRNELKRESLDVEIEAAAEYYIDFEFKKKLEAGNLLTFGNKYLLFEVSFLNPPDNLSSLIFDMQIKGYKPIMAHPERYPYWYGKLDKFTEFKDKGVLLQLNLMSLTGHYGPHVRMAAEKMLDANLIDMVGSDLHNVHHLEVMKHVRTFPYAHKILSNPNLLNYKLMRDWGKKGKGV